MDSSGSDTSDPVSPYQLLSTALSLIPFSHFFSAFLTIFLVFLYNFFEIHLLHDFIRAFRGDRVSISASDPDFYQSVVSKCRILHGRYSSTPWLCSPHLQTIFLSIFGRSPPVSYKRQLFRVPDGGTIALDWLRSSDVECYGFGVNVTTPDYEKTPTVIVIPGLTSDSSAAYIKHLAFRIAKRGWNVVVSNHRGLGGISLTSERVYNAAWTEDIRRVVGHIHSQHPEAPLFVVGTSIGANVLVKYLGEDGANVPVSGAAAICSPWDLLICDRFINRRLVQSFYNKALANGLQGFALLHQSNLSRLTEWESIKKDLSSRTTIGTARHDGGLYFLTDDVFSRNDYRTSLVSLKFSTSENNYLLWHYRLGHPNFQYMKHLFSHLFRNINVSSLKCEVCIRAKQSRVSFHSQPYKPSKPFNLVHSDFWGPSPTTTSTGKRWFVTFIDDHTRLTWVFLLTDKSEVLSVFQQFYATVET
ncbi:embryogenesis-associated protein EMB8 isoform X4 [Benincasa hispida]|uniref:embryogenesis-associated protein EMB8 isoform X4 n=1 Tax=Benincasa hispida TaxID=102211 RepID=UPI001901DCE7|nr:embryogenesis-associated protein EMB8 isoform X4 [Benincasa hispida]